MNAWRKSCSWLLAGTVLIAALAGCWWWWREQAWLATDDAFVSADYSVISARVAAPIAQVWVQDNQWVRQGQLLATLDERDYAVAEQAAAAREQAARGELAQVGADLRKQASAIEQARAAARARLAQRVFASADFARYRELAAHGAGSTQSAEQARARIDGSAAELVQAEAAVQSSRAQLDVLQAQQQRAEAGLVQALAEHRAARLRLEYTRIIAPFDGMVGQRAMRVGAYVTVGTPMLAVVPLRQAYVLAHFQETQLEHVLPGQVATVRVDGLPGLILHAHVDSLAPATGASFAPFAPDNATGNFTKVVQRIPVKLRLDADQPGLARLRLGMSAQVSIRVEQPAAPQARPVVLR